MIHGADIVVVEAVAHTQHRVHLVAGVQPGDQLVDLLHKVDVRRGVGAGAHFNALDDGANGHGVVAADKVLHLGQDDRQIAQFLWAQEAGEDIGQLEGLVFSNFDLIHDKLPLILLYF